MLSINLATASLMSSLLVIACRPLVLVSTHHLAPQAAAGVAAVESIRSNNGVLNLSPLKATSAVQDENVLAIHEHDKPLAQVKFSSATDGTRARRSPKTAQAVATAQNGDKSITITAKIDDTTNWSEQFHIIRNKDMPGILDLENFRSASPKACANSALERAVNFVVWRDGACYLKHTEDDVGFLTTRFALPINGFNIPSPNSDSTTSEKQRDEWVRTGVCDLIQEYEGYGYYCKSFKSSAGTVMMFRKKSLYMGEAGQKSRSGAIYRPTR